MTCFHMYDGIDSKCQTRDEEKTVLHILAQQRSGADDIASQLSPENKKKVSALVSDKIHIIYNII